MDEFNPEEELKPDASDRRPTRPQSRNRSAGFSMPSVSLSRQHTMIGIGIVVLLLLIVGIGSALQSPGQGPTQQSGAAKNIDLSSSMTQSQQSGSLPPPTAPAQTTSVPSGNQSAADPQSLSGQPISSSPTQAVPSSPNGNQQRIELPGNITDALSQPQQQDRVNALSQGAMGDGAISGLPTAPATVVPTGKGHTQSMDKSPTMRQPTKPAEIKADKETSRHVVDNVHKMPTTAITPAPASKPAAVSKPATVAASGHGGSIQSAPVSAFTLQLSSASREESLKAYARDQRLANYWVYETKRDGKPWYVLVNGVYASSDDAKRAIASLPADVQAKKPWVKPIRQVKQDLTK
ncbi:SPOR domain-containing protein [Musicola paradisiaca]|uniref:Cell division protein DamX n=1 Tax=Musicola paradisiaca (strain Ech703) TaxID=579405 RepID=C6C810_MUSP7|nr:SPOR domain-containing protein [Musicola paradisiaca]ACS84155.1 Sporulation domain protein [Musicola paradisiaca Ech703]